jgi:hypothetical protein
MRVTGYDDVGISVKYHGVRERNIVTATPFGLLLSHSQANLLEGDIDGGGEHRRCCWYVPYFAIRRGHLASTWSFRLYLAALGHDLSDAGLSNHGGTLRGDGRAHATPAPPP